MGKERKRERTFVLDENKIVNMLLKRQLESWYLEL